MCSSRSDAVSRSNTLVLRSVGEVGYTEAQRLQRALTDQRQDDTADEIWLLSHPAVFTLGQAGKRDHILDAGPIDVVQSDRGGQVTYHGPGQLVVYTLFDLRRHELGVRALVTRLESVVIALLGRYGVDAEADPAAPGVYVSGAKIAALGLRIRRGCSYHGLSLNVSLDLSVYDRINPCGYPNMAVTRTRDHGILADEGSLGDAIAAELAASLRVDRIERRDHLPTFS